MVTNVVMPDQLGGLQRYVNELAAALVTLDLRVTILTKRVSPDLRAEEFLPNGVRVCRYDVPSRRHVLYAAGYPLASLRAVALAAARSRDVIHVHYPLQGVGVAIRPRPYLHTFHAPIYRELLPEHQDRYPLPASLQGAMLRTARSGEAFVARRATGTVVLTEFMRRELAMLAPRAAEHAEIIPGGLDAERFKPGSAVDHPLARGADPLLLTARRLVPRTGVQELVRAMPAVLSDRPGARLVIAGDGPLRGDLEHLIRDLALQERVHMIGYVSDANLLGWYRAADLFVLPTTELEGFGMSTIEALACGTPAIGTPVGGTPEILKSLDPDLIAPGSSADDLAATILRVVNQDGRLQALATRTRAHIVPRMSWPVIAERHLALYERVAAAGR